MKEWEAIATENLRKRSAHPSSFDEMKKEWIVSDVIVDNKTLRDPDDWPSCELCEHEKLRWQFEIKNRKNGNKTMVGSTCIKKFDIPISSGSDVLLYGTFRNKILDSKIATLQEKYNTAQIRASLTSLAKKDMAYREKILHIIDYWEEEKSLTPLMACLIISRCTSQEITLGDAELAISIQSLDNRIEILHMDESQFHTILPFLKKNQIARCMEFRKTID